MVFGTTVAGGTIALVGGIAVIVVCILIKKK